MRNQLRRGVKLFCIRDSPQSGLLALCFLSGAGRVSLQHHTFPPPCLVATFWNVLPHLIYKFKQIHPHLCVFVAWPHRGDVSLEI